MKTKAQKAVEILEQYAEECKTLPRGTSDLSPLEQWLLVKLIDSTILGIGIANKTGYHHKQRLTLDEYLKLLFPKKNE